MHVQRVGYWLLGSGVAGGFVGASLTLWLAPQSREEGRASERTAQSAGTDTNPDVEKALARIARLERAVRLLESQRLGAVPVKSVAQGSAAGAASEAAPTEAAPSEARFDPVFEAAVLDVLERAEEERDSERDERRRERAQQRAEHWAGELTTRLGLAPAQTTKLAEIQQRLSDDLLEQRRARPEGQFVPREERRAVTRALRARAERELREVLDGSQLAGYEALEGRLRIVKPDDAD